MREPFEINFIGNAKGSRSLSGVRGLPLSHLPLLWKAASAISGSPAPATILNVTASPDIRPDISRRKGFLQRVSKIGSASDQVLTSEAGERVSFCHEETAEAVDGRAVGAD